MSQFSEPASEAASEATMADSLEEDVSGEAASMVGWAIIQLLDYYG